MLKNLITLEELIAYLTIKPAEAFGLPYGTIEVGAAADIVILNLDEERAINPDEFLSKGRNTPFTGWKCKGWPVMTISEGQIVWEKGCVTA